MTFFQVHWPSSLAVNLIIAIRSVDQKWVIDWPASIHDKKHTKFSYGRFFNKPSNTHTQTLCLQKIKKKNIVQAIYSSSSSSMSAAATESQVAAKNK